MRGLKFASAFGPVEFRAIDHQSTLGAYVGRLDVKDGKGVMVGWRYRDGAKYLPLRRRGEEAAAGERVGR